MKSHAFKLLILTITLSIGMTSCDSKSKTTENHYSNNDPLRILNNEFEDAPSFILSEHPDTLIVFSDVYPVGVRIFKDNIIIKATKTDTCINVYDRNNLSLKWKTGVVGNGPEDVLTPTFFASISPDSIGRFQMADVSDNSHIYLDLDEKKLSKSRFPNYIGYCSSINLSDQYAVAARNIQECMFFIYDKSKKETLPVLFDIDCGESIKSKLGHQIGYMLSALTYANAEKGRIIVPHYFFDIYSVYDYSGKCLRKISLSSNDFNESAAAEKLIDNESYIGFLPSYASFEACYLMRKFASSPQADPEYYQIIKTDWDGIPMAEYRLSVHISGDFCINDNKLYGISKITDPESEDYALLCWNLNLANHILSVP